LWLVEGLAGDRFALLSKTHHALVDGISGVDILTVVFDTAPDPAAVAPPGSPWTPRPLPTAPQLLADALLERMTVPSEIAKGARRAARGPRRLARRATHALAGIGAMTWAGLHPAPHSLFNVRIGPHRRFTWVSADLADFKLVKDRLGGTVNDAVLAAVTGALGSYLRSHAQPTVGLVLKAMVPVSVRVDADRGALGNRVAAMWAPLPVGAVDPAAAVAAITQATAALKASGQAVGAQMLTDLTGFAPTTILAQAARLQAHQRMFNLVVTNVPGPQAPLYLLGRELEAVYPLVPLAENTALGIAVMSYNGSLAFGLTCDFDAIPDVDLLASELHAAIEQLVAAARDADPHPPTAGPQPPPAAPRGRRLRIRAVT
jgi:WS/DGAT/MGAT family acyltransferase